MFLLYMYLIKHFRSKQSFQTIECLKQNICLKDIKQVLNCKPIPKRNEIKKKYNDIQC